MRILIVKLSSLGDLFHALPAVSNLKAGLGAVVDWATQTEYEDVVRCFKPVDHVVGVRRRNLIFGLNDCGRRIREDTYDYVIDLQGLLKSALVARLAKGNRTIGPSFHREGSRMFYSEIAGQRNKERHAVDENLDVVRHLGLTVANPEFPVAFPEVDVGLPRPRVAFLPLSRWRSKNWPVDRYAAVARELRSHANASIYVFGQEGDLAACRAIEDAAGGYVRNMAGHTSLVELGGHLANMDLVITNDSGPLHMAAAAGIPVLALYGPTDSRRTGPYGERHRVLTGAEPCRPCFRRKCKFGAPKCLLEITPDVVTEAALEMLGR